MIKEEGLIPKSWTTGHSVLAITDRRTPLFWSERLRVIFGLDPKGVKVFFFDSIDRSRVAQHPLSILPTCDPPQCCPLLCVDSSQEDSRRTV